MSDLSKFEWLSVARAEGALDAKDRAPNRTIQEGINQAVEAADGVLANYVIASDGPPLKKWMQDNGIKNVDGVPLEVLSALAVKNWAAELRNELAAGLSGKTHGLLLTALSLGRAHEALEIHIAYGSRLDGKRRSDSALPGARASRKCPYTVGEYDAAVVKVGTKQENLAKELKVDRKTLRKYGRPNDIEEV